MSFASGSSIHALFERVKSAAVIATGSELANGSVADRNTEVVVDALAARGVTVTFRAMVTDDVGVLADALLLAGDVGDVVVVTGGLGPTHDDLTREAVARATGRDLQPNARLRDYVDARCGWATGAVADRLAMLPAGAEPIIGIDGGVAGFVVDRIVAMPGVPAEMRAMLEALLPMWPVPDAIGQGRRLVVDTPLTESELVGPVEAVGREFPDVEVGLYTDASAGYRTRVVLRCADAHRAESARARLASSFRARRARIERGGVQASCTDRFASS